jgi:hypothetical protein
MARASLTVATALGSYPTLQPTANALDLAMAAANVADKNQFTASGNDLVFAHNTGVGAVTVTITSVADPYKRTGDITAYSIGAGEYAHFGPFKMDGWKQTDGKIYLEASSADVKFGVVALP